MATEARVGMGSRFEIGDGADPEVYTQLAEVININPPSMSRDALDATHMLSPEQWREFVPGLKDGGEVSVDMNFIPGGAGETQIMANLAADNTANYRITFPNGVSWTFAAFCTGFEPSVPHDDKMSATATFKVSGKPTFLTA
jgi:predicted secreted protein